MDKADTADKADIKADKVDLKADKAVLKVCLYVNA